MDSLCLPEPLCAAPAPQSTANYLAEATPQRQLKHIDPLGQSLLDCPTTWQLQNYCLLESIHVDDQSNVVQTLQDALQHRGTYQLFYRLNNDDNNKWIWDWGFYDAEQSAFVGVLVEVNHPQLREQIDPQLQTIFDESFDFIGLLHLDGTLIRVNQSAMALIDNDQQPIIGKKCWQAPWWSHDEQRQKLKAGILRAAQGAFVRFETILQQVNDGPRNFDFSIKPIRDNSGNLVMLLTEGRDITERKANERALRDAYRGLSRQVRQHSNDLDLTKERLALEIVERQKQELIQKERSHIFKLLATGADLQTTLDAIISNVRQVVDAAHAEILLYDDPYSDQPQTLVPTAGCGAMANVFRNYARLQENGSPGQHAHCWQQALDSNQLWLTDDIGDHPQWPHFRADAKQLGVTSTWSQRIVTANGTVLGLLTLLHRQSQQPLPLIREFIQASSHLIGLAIEHQKADQQLAFLAKHDPLTGLLNRQEFEQRLQQTLDRTQIDNSQHGLLFMDIDQFKLVNDTCGHMAGDELLRQLAEILQLPLHSRDALARLGGDEFGIILQDSSHQNSFQIANQLRKSVQHLQFHWQGQTFSFTTSIGLIIVDQQSSSSDQLMSLADTACFEAKDDGRNRVNIYRPEDEELLQRQGEMHWATKIAEFLKNGDMQLYYQEIRPLNKKQTPLHYEILLRAGIDAITPEHFLPAAERYNLMPQVDRWVTDQVLDWLLKHPRHLKQLGLCSINLSGHTLNDSDTLEHIYRRLRDTPRLAQKICFEITETMAMINLDKARCFMERFRDLGCRFALDDFGSGFSSYTQLKELPVDYLKIDGSFVRGASDDPVDLNIIQSINDIGHAMGKKTVAEYVESPSILKMLEKVGVDYVQGFELSRPQPLTRVLRPDELME